MLKWKELLLFFILILLGIVYLLHEIHANMQHRILPVSGRASEGTLTVMASGPEDAFEAARIPLDSMSSKVVKVGAEWGLGSALKTVNQCLAGVHIAASAEVRFNKKI